MQTTDFLSMQTDYSARTRGAKHVIDAAYPLAIKALEAQLPDFSRPTFGLADFGAADGGTSLGLMLRILQKVQQTYPSLPIHLNYSDLPDNDFNALARLLQDIQGKSLQQHFRGLTYSMSPVSFYAPILPPESLSLGFSATAMHWLPTAPAAIPDHVHIAASSDESAREIYREAAHQALLQILSHRLRELQPGGHFLLVNFGINDQGHYLGNTEGVHMFNQFHRLWQDMVAEGKIHAEELQRMNFPQYYRRPDDYRRALSDPALEGKLELVAIEDLTTPCPYRAALHSSGDTSTFLEEYPHTLQTWSYHVFFIGLDPARPEAERHALTQEMYTHYRQDIAQRPEAHGMDYVHHLVMVKRTDR